MSARPPRPTEPPVPSQAVRLAEALIFSAPVPLGPAALAARLPPGTDVPAVVAEIARAYATRGLTLVRVAGGYAFRTAPDLAGALRGDAPERAGCRGRPSRPWRSSPTTSR